MKIFVKNISLKDISKSVRERLFKRISGKRMVRNPWTNLWKNFLWTNGGMSEERFGEILGTNCEDFLSEATHERF